MVPFNIWNESSRHRGSQALAVCPLQGLSRQASLASLLPLIVQDCLLLILRNSVAANSVRLGHTLVDTSQLSFQTQKKKINTPARELGYCCFNPGFQTIPSRMRMESPGKSLEAGQQQDIYGITRLSAFSETCFKRRGSLVQLPVASFAISHDLPLQLLALSFTFFSHP